MKELTIISLLVFSFLLTGCTLPEQNITKQATPTNDSNTNKIIANDSLNTNQAEDQITETKKYKNDQFGFEFQYPKNWTIDDERTKTNIIVFDIGIPESREAISFVKNTENLTLAQLEANLITDDSVVEKKSEMTIGGEKALLIETTEMGLSYIIFNHKNNSYTITSGGRMIELGIISTFKFTD